MSCDSRTGSVPRFKTRVLVKTMDREAQSHLVLSQYCFLHSLWCIISFYFGAVKVSSS